jgi:hypothetical protein
MDIITNYVYDKVASFTYKQGVLLISGLFILVAGFTTASFLLINTIEFLGILLGSLAGTLSFFFFIIAFKVFLKGKEIEDIRHRVSISMRRKTSGVAALGYLIIVAVFGEGGRNPLFGVLSILVFGMLAYFASISDEEKAEIEKVADDIIWQYEAEQKSQD